MRLVPDRANIELITFEQQKRATFELFDFFTFSLLFDIDVEDMLVIL